MSSTISISEDFNHLFEISLGGGVSLQAREAFNEIPQDGMFTVDEFGDYVPVLDPATITDDEYFENDLGDITIKTLI